MLIVVAVRAVVAAGVSTLQLSRQLLTDYARDDVIRDVARSVALAVQAIEALLAETILTFWAIAARYVITLYAIQLPMSAGINPAVRLVL